MKTLTFPDLTFMIPVRLDSTIRIENLLAVVKFARSFQSKILIYEAAAYNNHFVERLLPKDKNITYRFFIDRDPVFYRTHYLNMMTRESSTPYLAIWDADVVVYPAQMDESMTMLRDGKADISYPYDGTFLDVDIFLREQYIQSPRISFLTKYKDVMNVLYGKDLKGGGILVNRQKYMAAGMENEKFYGWGPEDFERYDRWQNMGYTIHRATGPMFHLNHPRDMNGRYRSPLQNRVCELQYSNTRNSSKEEILKQIQA